MFWFTSGRGIVMVRTVSAGLFMSLDGVVAADSDWQFPWFDEELLSVIAEGAGSADTVLMGRVSATGYASLREEHPDSPMLAFLEGVERYMVSATVGGPEWSVWPGTAVIRPSGLAHTVDSLKSKPGAGILVSGSPTVVRALLASGQLDELLLMLLPVVVGAGHRLFPESADGTGPARLHLDLADQTRLESGAMALRYRPQQLANG